LRAGPRAKGGMAGRLGTLVLASTAVLLILPAAAAYADAAATAAGTAAHGPSAWDVLVAILRGIEYALLLLACGLALLSMLGRDLPLRLPVVPVAAALLASGVVAAIAGALLASRLGRSMGRRDHGAGAAAGDRQLAGRGK
jgi:hypothetical protein